MKGYDIMTNLELAICEAENSGEIDLDTRDMMLGILTEATRQAKESEKFNIRYIKPLYRKKHILENRERELEGKIYTMKRDKIYKKVDEDELDRLEKELQDVREKLKQCGEEIKKVEEKRDKIDECGKYAFALSNGRMEAKRRAGNSRAIALNKVIDKDIMPVYNKELSIVDNNWAGLPFVARVSTISEDPDKRATKAAREGHGNYIYLLKWRK